MLSDWLSRAGKAARAAAKDLGRSSSEQRNAALVRIAHEIRAATQSIMVANSLDLTSAKENGASAAFLERIALTSEGFEAMAAGLENVAARPDPIGRILAQWTQTNGLDISRVSVPIGVIGIIYESRPNVTADAGALCLKSANAAILRSGSDALRTCLAIHAAMVKGLGEAGFSRDCIQLVPTPNREAVGRLLSGLDGSIDLIIPRGGKSLVKRVQDEARVPVLAHLEGVNHVYVDAAANPEMAVSIAVNAKMRRVSVCGAAEKLLIDQQAASALLPPLVKALRNEGCELRGDQAARVLDPTLARATQEDWRTEYLDAIMTVGIVDGVEGAIAHIRQFGSQHTDAIVTEDRRTAEKFLSGVDSAIVLWNASTQFADGAQFGMGAEIGIATGRLHARGPVGADELTTYKYIVRGHGQIRSH
jgi:glutamate-5-semialdehyde dehydrogenase